MPELLFIALHRPDRSPSQRFRYEQYVGYLEDHGWNCHVSYLIEEKWDGPFYSSGQYFTKLKVLTNSIIRRIKDVLRAQRYDVIYVQREAIMIGTPLFEYIFSKTKAKLIFDFDDAIWLPNVSDANQNLQWLKSPAKTGSIIKMADVIFAGNQFLAEYAAHFNDNVKVVPTTIDTSYHQLNGYQRRSDVVCIGWTGSKTTIKHFEEAVPVLKKIREKYGSKVQFKVIGDPDYRSDELNLTGIKWDAATEIQELSALDIGIMPLPDDDWSRGKCGLKGLQYMALEMATVMSPVGVNKEIMEDGITGFLPSGESEWFNRLCTLIENEALRAKMGKAARARVIEAYSVQSQRDAYLKYLNELV